MPSTQESQPETSDGLKIALLVVLVVAFLIAVPLMFVHPGLVMILFWSGLIIIGCAWVIHFASTRLGRH